MKFEIIESELSDTIRRTRTPLGWLVLVTSDVLHFTETMGIQQGYDWRTSVTFVLDPFHLWKIGGQYGK